MNPRLKTVLFCLLLIALAARLGASLVGNRMEGRFIHSDAEGYYMYLPAVLIYGSFENLPVRTKEHFGFFGDSKKVFTKYTYGTALLELPFFATAYLLQTILGIEAGEYTTPAYSLAILVAACFYGVLGLYFLYKSLHREFEHQPAALLACAALLLGTNLLFYMVREPGMSHVYSFFVISCLLYLVPGFYQKAGWRQFLLMGSLAGLMVLIRPTNAVVLLYPLLYGVPRLQGLGQRLLFFKKHPWKTLAAASLVPLFWLPQMAYWHYLTGDWFFYAYTHEGFHLWKEPQILNVLAGPLNGWLTYNPILVFSLVGMPFLLKGNQAGGVAVLLIFLVSLYLFASWWMWWFGGAYGYRSFVDLLPVLAIPLCFTFKKIRGLPVLVRTSLLLIALLCCLYNFHLILLFSWDWSNHNFNWASFGAMLKDAFF